MSQVMWEGHANVSADIRSAASHCPWLSLALLTRFSVDLFRVVCCVV